MGRWTSYKIGGGSIKARVKATGTIIDVIPKCNPNAQHSADNLYVCNNMIFRECELDFLNGRNLIKLLTKK